MKMERIMFLTSNYAILSIIGAIFPDKQIIIKLMGTKKFKEKMSLIQSIKLFCKNFSYYYIKTPKIADFFNKCKVGIVMFHIFCIRHG